MGERRGLRCLGAPRVHARAYAHTRAGVEVYTANRAICGDVEPSTPVFQVKSSCQYPNYIEWTAHVCHKPRAAWVLGRLLLYRYRRSRLPAGLSVFWEIPNYHT